MLRSLSSIFAISLLFGIFAAFNTFIGTAVPRFSVDLTQEKLYSLTEGSRKIVQSVETPVTLKYYFSRTDSADAPSIKIYGQSVLELLEEYAELSNGSITLEVFDPRPDSDEELWASKYGLQAIPTGRGINLFLGVVGINSTGHQEALPFLDSSRQEFLEYDVSRLIYNLQGEAKKKAVLYSSLELRDEAKNSINPDSDWVSIKRLGETTDLDTLGTAEIVPESADLVVLVHPKKLSDTVLKSIYAHLAAGKNVIAFMDPFHTQDIPQNPMLNSGNEQKASDLGPLLGAWGVEFEPKIVGDENLLTEVQSSGSARKVSFLGFSSLSKEELSRNDVTTAKLENVVMPFMGSFNIKETEGVNVEVLAETSTKAATFNDGQVSAALGNPDILWKSYKPGDKKLVIAARLSGRLPSPYENAEENKIETPEQTGSVLLISDADFISDAFSVRKQRFFGQTIASLLNDNLVFFENMVEQMLGSSALISIRSRGSFTRPFTYVQEIEKQAQAKWREQEESLQKKLQEVNQRLAELQSRAPEGGKQLLSQEMLGEIDSFKEQKIQAEQSLRKIRRESRSDIESLGMKLFVLNTFLVPVLLLISYFAFRYFKKERV